MRGADIGCVSVFLNRNSGEPLVETHHMRGIFADADTTIIHHVLIWCVTQKHGAQWRWRRRRCHEDGVSGHEIMPP